ncbi:MAG TPA: hypothetical protein VH394_06920 [Thermoanaerobaculia bacterium]|jgi:hypothetical protein|nr:hypothetical protein [Thermoanaerobaculia bacterium]
MRTFTVLLLSGLLALAAVGAHAQTGEQPFVLVRTPTGYLFVGNESKAHFSFALHGQKIRPSNLEGMAFFVDERLYQVLTVDPSSFAPGEGSARAILDRYMQYEASHWQATVGMEMPSIVHARSDSPGTPPFLLWEIQWTEQARQKTKAQAIKQLFLSAVAGDRVVVVSRTVLEGEDAGSALSDLSAIAQSLVIRDAPIDVSEIQGKIRDEP